MHPDYVWWGPMWFFPMVMPIIMLVAMVFLSLLSLWQGRVQTALAQPRQGLWPGWPRVGIRPGDTEEAICQGGDHQRGI